MAHYDLLIVGGGLAGTSLAVALRNSPLKLALVETQIPQKLPGWDARIYAVSQANVDFLSEQGVWRHLDAQRLAPIQAMEVKGDQGGQLNFSAYDVGTENLGWIVESSLMACELWESAKRQDNLTIYSPSSPVNFSQDHERVCLQLDDGAQLTATLAVGADGRDSWLRNQVGLTAYDTPYCEKGVVANFAVEKPHHHIARQWFGQNDVLAYLPLPDQQMSMVWSLSDQQADALLQQEIGTIEAQVAAAGEYALGKLTCITPPAAFPLRLIRVPQVVAPRVALIGDAAHGIHPLSGHGINLGFQDAKALAELLQQAIPGQDLGEIRFLSRYARARKEETRLMQGTTDALRQLFKSSLPGIGMLRNAGLNLTDRLSPIKNSMIRYAMGLI